MAADTRPYKSKEQDGQGNEVIIRDQQLVEQSTVTTMPSGACFETLDIDGRPVKIPRDNMMSIVLECIGIVLNDSSKNLGTNVNKALGLQGNTIGNVTVNDFASVLGVPYVKSTNTFNNYCYVLDMGTNNTFIINGVMSYGGDSSKKLDTFTVCLNSGEAMPAIVCGDIPEISYDPSANKIYVKCPPSVSTGRKISTFYCTSPFTILGVDSVPSGIVALSLKKVAFQQ